MIRRSWRYVVVIVVVLVALAAGGYWFWNRPARNPRSTICPSGRFQPDAGVPGTQARAQVIVATLSEDALSDKQLAARSRGGSAASFK